MTRTVGKVTIKIDKVKILDKINIDDYKEPDVDSEDRIQKDNVDGRQSETTTTDDGNDM